MPSVLEAAASDELAEEGGWRYLLVGHGGEIVDEAQQTVGLAVLRAVLGHAGQHGLGMEAQHGKLDEQGAVEHHVGLFLIREYPFLLGLADLEIRGNQAESRGAGGKAVKPKGQS